MAIVFSQAMEGQMLKSFAIRCFTAVLILMAAAGGAFARGDAVPVQQQLFDALARGDVRDALALFTDDAVIDEESGLCWKTSCVGNAAIQKDLERFPREDRAGGCRCYLVPF
jgi:hypothetical protein